MVYDRERYEELIIQSPLFSLDKEKDETAYKRESLKMVEYLYCYLLGINESRYEPYGYEITIVAKRCIKGFSGEKGEFLHYFNAAWKQEYLHICGNEALEDKFHGVKITEEDKRNIRKYLKLARSFEKRTSCEELLETIADAMNLPLNTVVEIAKMSSFTIACNVLEKNEAEVSNRLAQIPDPHTHLSVDLLVSSEGIGELLDKIEEAFLKLQTRQRPIISDAITVRIAEEIIGIGRAPDRYSFINQKIMKKYKDCSILPTQRDVADKFGRSEASISRSVKKFILKLNK